MPFHYIRFLLIFCTITMLAWLAIGNEVTWAAPAQGNRLQLTVEESQWLKEHPVIRVASDPSWRPLEYLDTDGEFKGIAIDYLNKVGNLLGIRFEFIKDASWAELVAKSKAGDVDMFSCIAETPDRLTYLKFTKPYLSLPASIFTRRESPYIGELEELVGEKVAVVNGYAFHELIAQNFPGINLVPVDSVSQGLKLLNNGDVAAFVGNLLVGGYYITTEGILLLKVAGETPYRNNLGFAVRNDWPQFAAILQKALDAITPEEKREIYKNWVALTYEHKYDQKLLLEILAVTFTVIGLFFIAFQQKGLRNKKRAMIETARSKAVFEAVFNSITDAMVLTDPQRKILLVNKAFSRIFGYTLDEAKNRTTEFLYADPSSYQEQGKLRYSTDTKMDQPVYEMEYRRKDGTVFPGETMGVKVSDSTGQFIGYLGCIRDITERKKTQEQLLINDRLKSEFIAMASHELRTPLTVILGFVELLSDDNLLNPQERHEAIACIHEKGLILERMVNDLLDVSRIESGGALQLEKSETSLQKIVEQVMKHYQKEQHNCSLEIDFPDGPLVCAFDKDRMLQVFENLIGNAIKFSPKGGIILVKGVRQDNRIVISIQDNGIGINEEEQAKVFDKFYRVNNADTAPKGLGLGLYVVRNIILAHGGDIWVESSPADGTKISFYLPLAKS